MGQGQSASSGDRRGWDARDERYELLKQDEDDGSVIANGSDGPFVTQLNNHDEASQELLSPGAADRSRSSESSSSLGISHTDETMFSITVEVFLPFLVAGFGMVGAGVVLDIVQHWPVFEELDQLFILVPALLGLKGNLEMTLASRLSTQANLGNLDSRSQCTSIVLSNLALIQCQGIVIGFAASVFAAVMDTITTGSFDFKHGILLSAASMVTASIASFALGVVMVVVIVLSRKFRVNPDNVATPIAASLGDLVTLSLLSWIASLLYNDHSQAEGWLAPVIIGLYFLAIPACVYAVTRNKDTTKVLYCGWTPVIIAMSISSLGGLILNKAVNKFSGIAVFQPVFNGVGGNLVAVQASRISTYLHTNSILGVLPNSSSPVKLSDGGVTSTEEPEKVCASPWAIVSGPGIHNKTCRILLGIAIPGHFLFAFTISTLKAGHTSTTAVFYVFYLIAAFFQIWILLCSAHWMVFCMWKRGTDPDNASIPYLTALGDLLGGALLAFTFELLFLIGDRDLDVGD